MTTETTYFKVLEAFAGPRCAFDPARVLMVRGTVPDEIREFERRGLVRRLPTLAADVRAWLDVLVDYQEVGAETFAPAPSSAPLRPAVIDKPEVLRRLGWTATQLDTAIARLEFPRHVKTAGEIVDEVGYVPKAWFWEEDAVELWRTTAPAMTVFARP